MSAYATAPSTDPELLKRLEDAVSEELDDALGDYTDECGEWPPIGALTDRIVKAIMAELRQPAGFLHRHNQD